MDNEILHLCAYHESGRVVFAYMAGYACDKMQLSDADSGQGESKLDAGDDLPLVQAVLGRGSSPVTAENMTKAIAAAKKLMNIYCAGTCAETFFRNNGSLPDQLDMDIPGQDIQNIELIQSFLKSSVSGHPDDFPSQTMIEILKKLQDRDTWKAVTKLAEAAIAAYDKPLNRFYIEDALMAAGFKIQKRAVRQGFSIGVERAPHTVRKPTDDHQAAEKPIPEKPSFDFGQENPLDIVLRDFLRKIKHDWKEGEADAAANHIKGIFEKYG